jgi:hypothetical protein
MENTHPCWVGQRLEDLGDLEHKIIIEWVRLYLLHRCRVNNLLRG